MIRVGADEEPDVPGFLAKTTVAIAMLLAISAAWPALAADAWQADEGKAAATLPPPRGAPDFTGGRLVCEEQDWRLTLDRPAGGRAGTAPLTLSVDRREFDTKAVSIAGGVAVAVPYEALEPLKAGARLRVAMSGSGNADAVFSLRGSRKAIGAMEERCSPRDLPEEGRIVFSGAGENLALARDLRENAIRDFRAATDTDPAISAAMPDREGDKKLFFVRLCGTAWYFGLSGCNVSAFVRDGDDGDWRLVLDTEGAAFYLPEESGDAAWPRLFSRSARGPAKGRGWVWSGQEYRVEDPVPQWALRD